MPTEYWYSDLPELKGQKFGTSREAHEAEERIRQGIIRKAALEELAALVGKKGEIERGVAAEERVSQALSAMPAEPPREDGRLMSRGFAVPESDAEAIRAKQKAEPYSMDKELAMFRAKYPEIGEDYQRGIKTNLEIKEKTQGGDGEDEKKAHISEINEKEGKNIIEWAEKYSDGFPQIAAIIKSAAETGDYKTAKKMQNAVIEWMRRLDLLEREDRYRKQRAERDAEMRRYEWEQRGKIRIRKKPEKGED